MEECLEIKIPGKPKMMRLVRRNVSMACEMVGFKERETNAITLAVDEGCTNIIRHCYGEKNEGLIVVRIHMFPDKIVVSLKDFGGKVDLRKLERCRKKKQRSLERAGPVKPGGLGVMLIHNVMDRVQYKTSSKSGTVLRLTKYLSHTKEAEVAG
ncbi:MAG: ATP-binding protein [Candidatus Glassbacteria bacterium]|nr:ATP-binding protein [Candidatus Glassbacteria bacterium]